MSCNDVFLFHVILFISGHVHTNGVKVGLLPKSFALDMANENLRSCALIILTKTSFQHNRQLLSL